MNNQRRWKLGIYSVFAGMAIALLWYFGPSLYHILHGLGLLNSRKMRTYRATNEKNLKALWTALMDYHDTEGQFPDSKKWMDAVKSRIRVDDMRQSESAKKLVNPLFPAEPGVYGYAMNDAASNKYKGDIKDPKMPLIFDSSDTSWDAHGKPATLKPKSAADGGDEGITVDGQIIKLR